MKSLNFTPYAWAKLIYMRDKGDTEVAGYGISSIEEPLLVTDFVLVKQKVTSVTFEFDDDGHADYVDYMIEENFQPAEFQRILIHTHPGNSAIPSMTDEENFQKNFSTCNWAIMFILARKGQTTCALKYKTPNITIQLETKVDFLTNFIGSDEEAWEEEYKENVKKEKITKALYNKNKKGKNINTAYSGWDYKINNNYEYNLYDDIDEEEYIIYDDIDEEEYIIYETLPTKNLIKGAKETKKLPKKTKKLPKKTKNTKKKDKK